MTCNVGGIERPIRILLGILLLAAAALGNLPTLALAMALVLGGIAVLTGAIGYCPLWALFGMTTCPAATSHKE